MNRDIRTVFHGLFILDLEFFQKLMNFSVNSCKKNVREKRSELILCER